MMALIVQALTAIDFAPAVGAACAVPLSATAAANAKTIAHFFIRILLCFERQAMIDAANGIGLASNYKIARRDFSA